MSFLFAAVGAAMLAYVVFLISGVGVALLAFAGIMLIVNAIHNWFLETRNNMVRLHGIQCELHRDTHRKLNNR